MEWKGVGGGHKTVLLARMSQEILALANSQWTDNCGSFSSQHHLCLWKPCFWNEVSVWGWVVGYVWVCVCSCWLGIDCRLGLIWTVLSRVPVYPREIPHPLSQLRVGAHTLGIMVWTSGRSQTQEDHSRLGHRTRENTFSFSRLWSASQIANSCWLMIHRNTRAGYSSC